MIYTLTTLGTCQLTDQQDKVVRAPLIALHLLAYLHESDQPVARRDLARLFWPAHPEAANTNLRSTLLRLAKAVPDAPAPLILADGTTLALNRNLVSCDLESGRAGEPLARLKAACDAVARQFLPMEAQGTLPFSAWVRRTRDRLTADLRDLTFAIAGSERAADARGDIHRAVILLLEHDPHDEEVRRHLAPARPTVEAMPATIVSPAASTLPVDALQPPTVTPPRVALLPPETHGAAMKAGSVANALIEDLTIDLCASRSVSVVAPYTSEQIRASNDKAGLLERHKVIYALDTKRRDDMLFVQLIFMPTDEVVWATRFPLDPHSVSTQRNEMAGAIKGAVSSLVHNHAHRAEHFTERPEAYFAYLRGIQCLTDLTLPSVRKARRHFREALDQERHFGMALAGISRTLSLEWILTARGDEDLLRQAETLALKAMEKNNELADAYKELGVSRLYLSKFDESAESLGRAEDLSPHYADVLLSLSDSLVHGGQPDLALDKIGKALALNPIAPDTYYWSAAGANFLLGKYEAALDHVEKMANAKPADRLVAACWAMLGQNQNARRYRNRVLKDNPDFNLERWLSVVPLKFDWQRDHYRSALSRAGF
jgi:DNA-binding SARP family transcriptional activator/tetratricopeptide (TPR) repeat protein